MVVSGHVGIELVYAVMERFKSPYLRSGLPDVSLTDSSVGTESYMVDHGCGERMGGVVRVYIPGTATFTVRHR